MPPEGDQDVAVAPLPLAADPAAAAPAETSHSSTTPASPRRQITAWFPRTRSSCACVAETQDPNGPHGQGSALLGELSRFGPIFSRSRACRT